MLRPLAVLALLALVAPLASAQHPEGIATVYGSVGYLAPNRTLDADGSSLLIPGDYAVVTARAGVEVHAARLAGVTATLGFAADFANAMAREGDLETASGFGPQNLRPYLRLAHAYGTVTAGYVVDQADETLPRTSDGQDAVWLGATARYAPPRFAVFAGVDAFLTEPLEVGDAGAPAARDLGDVTVLHAGGALRTRMVEVGVRAQLLTVSAATDDLADPVTDLGGDTRRAQIGLVPYLSIDPKRDPVAFTLMLGARGGLNQEYAPFGITLGGQSVPAPASPITVRLSIDV